MNVNNRELAFQAGLLMRLASTIVIGAGGFLLGYLPDVHQPQSLTLLPDSTLVILLCGLGLSAVMVNFTRCRQATALALVVFAGYTLLHNSLDTPPQATSLLSNHPRLPNQAVPTLIMGSLPLDRAAGEMATSPLAARWTVFVGNWLHYLSRLL